jgi:hypothetical protein
MTLILTLLGNKNHIFVLVTNPLRNQIERWSVTKQYKFPNNLQFSLQFEDLKGLNSIANTELIFFGTVVVVVKNF